MADEIKDPGLGITIQTQFHGKCPVTFQTVLPSFATEEEINTLLDRLMKTIDRQAAVYSLRDAELSLAKTLKDLALERNRAAAYEVQVRREYAQTEQGERDRYNGHDTFEWKGTWKSNYENYTRQIEDHQNNVLYWRERIEELRAIVGG